MIMMGIHVMCNSPHAQHIVSGRGLFYGSHYASLNTISSPCDNLKSPNAAVLTVEFEAASLPPEHGHSQSIASRIIARLAGKDEGSVSGNNSSANTKTRRRNKSNV